MTCPVCKKDQQGILVIGNNSESGCTEKLSVECHSCRSELMCWTFETRKSEKTVLNDNCET